MAFYLTSVLFDRLNATNLSAFKIDYLLLKGAFYVFTENDKTNYLFSMTSYKHFDV